MQETGSVMRLERPSDYMPIRLLHAAAFGQPAEGRLVNVLREAGDIVLSLVAMEDHHLVGHIAFSRMRAPFQAAGLAPVAVLPEQQGRGIGSRLVEAGLAQLKDARWEVSLLSVSRHTTSDLAFRQSFNPPTLVRF